MPFLRRVCTVLCASLALAASAAAAADEVREIERLWRGGEAALATQRLDKALAAQPGDAKLRFLKGVLLTDQKRDAEAVEVFRRLSEDYPDLPEPYNNLAVIHARQGRIDLARELLETALRHDSAYAAAHENLGDVFVALAQRAYERAQAGGRGDGTLQNKLKATRELVAPPR